MATTNLGLKTFGHDEPIDFNEWNDNLVKLDTAVGETKRGKAAHNLLDDSWFVNPVNQRGIASGAVITGCGYFIDRWKARGENCSISFSGEGITASMPIGQILPNETVKNGTTVTAAAMWSDGTICVASGTIRRTSEWSSFSSETVNGHYLYVSDEGDGQTACITLSAGTVVWAALYEGAYTADTLPAYVPKGYAAELAECERYFERLSLSLMANNTKELIIMDRTRSKKRIYPTTMAVKLNSSEESPAVNIWDSDGDYIRGNITFSTTGNHHWYGYLDISADL